MQVSDEDRGDTGRVVVGLIIAAIGVLLLLDRTGIAHIGMYRLARLWPLILIAFGLARLLDPPRQRDGRRHRSGGWLLWAGVWGLVSEFHLFGLHYGTSWPLFIIGAGVSMMWRAREPQTRGEARGN